MTLRVLYLPQDAAAAEEAAAWSWLARQPAVEARSTSWHDSAHAAADFQPAVLWLHATTAAPDAALVLDALRDGNTRGGMLLTGGAAALPCALGLESQAPECERRTWHNAEDELHLFKDISAFPHIRGHAAFRSHPLFTGLGSGTYTWWPHEGEEYTRVTYRTPVWPLAARVIAVERSYIHINHERATIWEYDVSRAFRTDAGTRGHGDTGTAGRRDAGTRGHGDAGTYVLCIGAYLPFASPDLLFRPLLERLVSNALRYAAGLPASPGPRVPASQYWRRSTLEAREDPSLTLPPCPQLAPLGSLHAPLTLSGAADPDAPVTLAGRRAFAAGGEAHGIEEIWAHPLRALKELRIAAAYAQHIAVTPIGVERALDVGGRSVIERTFVPRELPCAIVEWEAPAGARLELSWLCDLRLMWPYPAGALGPLHWRRDARALFVRAAHHADAAFYMFSHEPAEWTVADASTDAAAALRTRAVLELAAGESVRLAVVATAESDDLAATLAALTDVPALVRARAAAWQRSAAERLGIATPEARVDEAIAWAMYRLDSFVVRTPGVGRSLVAGYAAARTGWADGRPGYAWYFARDAVWAALALLATGDFDTVRDVIRFLGAHQDLSGKIMHECTTSGVVHYDAADATPLYLLLVARYLAWSGDLELVRAEWPRVRRALEFCLSTDTDDDGLIENPRVGHGWIELGALGGAKVTLYNAGIWAAALRELADAAEAIGEGGGEGEGAVELRARAERARRAIEGIFYDDMRGAYALDVRDGPTGEALRTWSQSALHAVPVLLGVIPPERAARWLDLIASEEFTTPWGVRLVGRSDLHYDAQSYHAGTVWPLFTGWVSWAEFACARADAGAAHWRQLVELGFERARGAWDEVLHGEARRAAGVCPDQAWSAAMVMAPLVYGLLGAEPDATRQRLVLRPQIPAEWSHFDALRLRVGDAHIRLSYRRAEGCHTFHITQESGAVPIRLIFEPAVPGVRLANARVDGRAAVLEVRQAGTRVVAPIQLVLDAERTIELETALDPVSAAASWPA